MKIFRALAVTALAVLAAGALAAWPDKAVHYIIPFSPGGESDIAARFQQLKFKQKFGQGDVVFSERRSLIFKKMQIVRGCDAKRNTLVYMVYSDRPIEGSPKNSTSTVPLMPWGTAMPPRCGEWVK